MFCKLRNPVWHPKVQKTLTNHLVFIFFSAKLSIRLIQGLDQRDFFIYYSKFDRDPFYLCLHQTV